jgi:hypothetical protein
MKPRSSLRKKIIYCTSRRDVMIPPNVLPPSRHSCSVLLLVSFKILSISKTLVWMLIRASTAGRLDTRDQGVSFVSFWYIDAHY